MKKTIKKRKKPSEPEVITLTYNSDEVKDALLASFKDKLSAVHDTLLLVAHQVALKKDLPGAVVLIHQLAQDIKQGVADTEITGAWKVCNEEVRP